jgi:tricorn protease
MRARPLLLIVSALAGMLPARVHGTAADRGARLFENPAISAKNIAFTYANDLWIAGLDGRGARRLTDHPGREALPHFSPDGRRIAFSGQYGGNTDVYVLPVSGGTPRRLTWHPGPDQVQGFTRDGRSVLFSSPRASHTPEHRHLFTVPVDGGFPVPLPVPHAFEASFSASGETLAYTPLFDLANPWKGYRGGGVTKILLYKMKDRSARAVPQPAEGCNDADPAWLGGRLYFRSDRDGLANLYVFDPRSGEVRALTRHADFPVAALSAGGGNVIYEQAGALHVHDPARGESRRLAIEIAADLPETRPRTVQGGSWIRAAALAPAGDRAAFEWRGDIVVVAAGSGAPRNLTTSSGVHERSPAWSPDGRLLAYFSDRSGEYELHVAPADGGGAVRSYPLRGSGFYEDLKWAPDGRKVSFVDESWSLYWLELGDGRLRRISSETLYGLVKTLHHAWSPDSRWIAYTRNTPAYLQRLWIYSLEGERSHPVTDGMSDVSEPVFDAGGRHLWFAAATDAGPVRDWFSQSSLGRTATQRLYLAVLRRGDPSPLGGALRPAPSGGEPVAIDLQGLDRRIVPLPLPPAAYSRLQPGEAGRLYYLKRPPRRKLDGGGPADWARFDLASGQEETLAAEVEDFFLSAGHSKALLSAGGSWSLRDPRPGADPGAWTLGTDAIQATIDPRAEWAQIFHEAWRIERDYFFDPRMGGVDWPALRAKYAAFLPHLTTRADLNRVLQWMANELSVSHNLVAGGDRPGLPKTAPVGLLGADFEVDRGRYRIRRVLAGDPWDPEARSPLAEPGVEAKAGEYLLAVAGRDLRPPENLHARFEGLAGRSVALTLGPHPDGSGAREVVVVPVRSEAALRRWAWAEDNRRRVDEATGGRVGYIHVPDTDEAGYRDFERTFFPQAGREALIVDARHNVGGLLPDLYLDLLSRPAPLGRWAMRHGEDLPSPLAAVRSAKVLLVDETTASGGEYLAWAFQKLRIGPVVGGRTWGGLVGEMTHPLLLDGGEITAPNLALWTEAGFPVENEGVTPDLPVEPSPEELAAGRDPRLEKAIEAALAGLAAPPSPGPRRPPFRGSPLRPLDQLHELPAQPVPEHEEGQGRLDPLHLDPALVAGEGDDPVELAVRALEDVPRAGLVVGGKLLLGLLQVPDLAAQLLGHADDVREVQGQGIERAEAVDAEGFTRPLEQQLAAVDPLPLDALVADLDLREIELLDPVKRPLELLRLQLEKPQRLLADLPLPQPDRAVGEQRDLAPAEAVAARVAEDLDRAGVLGDLGGRRFPGDLRRGRQGCQEAEDEACGKGVH